MATNVTVNAGQGSTQVTVITGEGSTSYSVSAGARGPAGTNGTNGTNGAAGPNSVTTSTSSNLTGFIAADGTNVSGATAGATAATANTLALRDATGGSNFAAVGATSVTSSGVISTTGATATISTSGVNGSISTSGVDAFIATNGVNAFIATGGTTATIFTYGADAHIYTNGANAYIQSRSTFKLYNGTATTTLSHSATADRAIAFPNDAGTLALTSGSQTFSGAQTFSGQVELTGQAATNGTSAMNRVLVDNRFELYLPSIYEWTKAVADYSATTVLSGNSSTSTNVMIIGSGVTAGGSQLLRSDGSEFRAWQKTTTGRQAVDWSKKTIHYVKISSDTFTGSDTVFRIHLGLPTALSTVQDLQTTNKAIGFNVIAGEIFATVANGSAVTTVTTGVTMTAWLVYDCLIVSNGDGTWSATVNSTTITGTGAPLNLGSIGNAALVMSATNGTTAASRRFFINNQKTMQF